MGRLLNELKAEAPATPATQKAETKPAPLANPANPATQGQGQGEVSQLSQDSQRVRLLKIAKRERYAEKLVRQLTEADLADCEGEPYEALVAYLQALEDTALREGGRVPPGHNGAILCRHCGPVFVSPDVARVLPKVNGWPTAVGCPWCHVRNRQFPRPPVQGQDCEHWQPGEGSSYAAGCCKCGTYYPKEKHRCEYYEPDQGADNESRG